MSKNIFSVLANDDSDEEVANNNGNRPTNKKQKRKQDRFLRETFGDSTGKPDQRT